MTTREIVNNIFPHWFETSKQATKLPHKRIAIFQAILTTTWVEVGPKVVFPMPVVNTIRQLIVDMRIPGVKRVSWDTETFPFATLLGIEGDYNKEKVLLFFLETEDIVIPLLSFTLPKEELNKKEESTITETLLDKEE